MLCLCQWLWMASAGVWQALLLLRGEGHEAPSSDQPLWKSAQTPGRRRLAEKRGGDDKFCGSCLASIRLPLTPRWEQELCIQVQERSHLEVGIQGDTAAEQAAQSLARGVGVLNFTVPGPASRPSRVSALFATNFKPSLGSRLLHEIRKTVGLQALQRCLRNTRSNARLRKVDSERLRFGKLDRQRIESTWQVFSSEYVPVQELQHGN